MRRTLPVIAWLWLACAGGQEVASPPPATAPSLVDTWQALIDASEALASEVLPSLPPPLPPLREERRAAIARVVDEARRHPALAGHTFGAYVLEAETGTVVFAHRAESPMIPASNTKIFTSAAALALLGEDYRIPTRVFASGPIDDLGVLHGDLHLHGAHDFTWARWFHVDPRAPLDALVADLRAAGLRRVAGNLGVWGAHCFDGHHFGTYRPGRHRDRVATQLDAALADAGITVSGRVLGHATMDLPPGDELARVLGVPLWVALYPINRRSHNEMADSLLRHLGWRADGGSDYRAGARASLAWLDGVGFDTRGIALHDGSGLAVDNRVSARQMVELYRLMAERPEGPAWLASMSIGGAGGPDGTDARNRAVVPLLDTPYMGTFHNRMTHPDSAGRVFGKSGTNAGITSSGVLFNRYDGRRYVFALQMNDIPQAAYNAARAAQDAMVAAFAGDNLGLHPRPPTPTLRSLTARGDGTFALRWDPVEGVLGREGEDAYVIELSADGRVFPTTDRAFATTHGLATLRVPGPVDRVYVRLRARGPDGESDPGPVFVAAAAPGAPRVLLVDAHRRWRERPADENPMGAPHDFLERYGGALRGVAIDTASREAVARGELPLDPYDAIVWALGEEAGAHRTFDPASQRRVASYLRRGGAILVSGADVAWDLDPRGNPMATDEDRAFLEGWLRVGYAGDAARVYEALPAPGGPLEGLEAISFFTPGAMLIAAADQLLPVAGSEPALVYTEGRGVAATAFAGGHRALVLGFPFESVTTAAHRSALMDRALALLGL